MYLLLDFSNHKWATPPLTHLPVLAASEVTPGEIQTSKHKRGQQWMLHDSVHYIIKIPCSTRNVNLVLASISACSVAVLERVIMYSKCIQRLECVHTKVFVHVGIWNLGANFPWLKKKQVNCLNYWNANGIHHIRHSLQYISKLNILIQYYSAHS